MQPQLGPEGCVRHGVASWTDDSLIECGKFYPPKAKKDDLLRLYGTKLSTVEVDMSTYVIPTVNRMEQWVKAVPKDFIFHVKAHQIFTHRRTDYQKLPGIIRESFAHPLGNGAVEIELKDIPVALQEQLIFLFVLALNVAVAANKMGFAIFQFPEDFSFSDENKAWITQLRKWLPANIDMAIEFRSRSWYTDAASRTANDPMTTEPPTERLLATIAFCKSLPATMISVDEYSGRDTAPSAKVPHPQRVVPILAQATSDQVLVRVHRRAGEHRVLTDDEIRDWAARVHKMLQDNNGNLRRIWFIWNTNYAAQPIENADKLAAALQPGLSLNWKAHYVEMQKSNKGSMFAFLAKSPAKKDAAAAKPAPSGGAPAPASAKRDKEEDGDGEGPTPSLSEEDATPSKKHKPAAPAPIKAFFGAPKPK